MQLARELGVPEVEIIRAMSGNRAMELDRNRWEELIRSFEAFGPVRVLVSNGGVTIEVVGKSAGVDPSQYQVALGNPPTSQRFFTKLVDTRTD